MSIVVVLLGTDHHPFDRLVDWADDAALRRPDTRCVVQHGSSRAPVVAEGRAFMAHDELLDLLVRAAVVVCHGGPGTIMDARGAGHIPICVPRDPALGEHVDGHQQRFAALVQRAGVVHHVDDQITFGSTLDREIETAARGVRPPVAPVSAATQEARTRLAQELDEMLVPRVRVARRRRSLKTPDLRP